MNKSPTEILEDMTAEIVALRREINAKVMSKEEAQALTKAMDNWRRGVEQAETRTRNSNADIEKEALRLATNASRTALTDQMEKMRAEALQAAKGHQEAAEKFRTLNRTKLRDIKLWVASAALLGILVGIVGVWLASDARSAADFGDNPSLWCSAAGGIKGTQDGREYCVFWFD